MAKVRFSAYNSTIGRTRRSRYADQNTHKLDARFTGEYVAILLDLKIKNFKCFRTETAISLTQGNYLIGPNNAGKTALLSAIKCFFDDRSFSPVFINKSDLAAKKKGFNRSEITIGFNISEVSGATRLKRMTDEYGQRLDILKAFTWTESSGTVSVEYIVAGSTYSFDALPPDVRDLIKAISISYIHPQEGTELLARAQEKFRQRLFKHWGRHASVSERVKALEAEWAELRKTANTYLSSALTTQLKNIWPQAEINVSLPARVQDIVAISDILFRTSPTLPQISLPSQGTGAQSVILYQTHYVLDSDRTLHSGMYFPIWLLEEPEAFLHADIAFQLGRLLSSDEWLDKIQIIVATHSPLILAGTKQNSNLIRWISSENHLIKWQKLASEIIDDDIREIGRMLGDAQFPIYFMAAARGPRVFLEDSHERVKEKLEKVGLTVTAMLGGITQVKTHLDVMLAFASALTDPTYFIVDNDEGIQQIQRFVDAGKVVATSAGWKKIEVAPRCYLIVLPEGQAAEDLFDQWQEHLEGAINDIYDQQLKLQKNIPTHFSRVVSDLRKRTLSSRDEIKKVLRKHQDIKDAFWKIADGLKISDAQRAALLALIPIDGGKT